MVVVGGGLAGLTAAVVVARAGRSVTVLESRNRLGGRARSDRRGRFLFNQGAHALYLGGAGHRILVELGVEPAGGPPVADARVLIDGNIRRLPTGPGRLLASGILGLRDKAELARVMRSLPRLDPSRWAGCTAGEWLDRHVSGERGRSLLEALVRLGTYVNAPDLLSAEAALTQLRLAMTGGVTYVRGGWGSLIDALVRTGGAGVTVRTGTPVGTMPDAPAVILAPGSPDAAARLLGTDFDTGPTAFASCLDLGVTRAPGHGFVLGLDRPEHLSDHTVVADPPLVGENQVAVMRYLSPEEKPDPADTRAGLDEMVARVGISPTDIVEEMWRPRMRAVSAFPTAAVGGFAGRPPVAHTDRPGVFLAGDWVGPVGFLADASIASGYRAGRAAVEHLEHRALTR